MHISLTILLLLISKKLVSAKSYSTLTEASFFIRLNFYAELENSLINARSAPTRK